MALVSSTYIFRFRDLGKSTGFTINEHNETIKENDHTWWGWWAKSGECFPCQSLGLAVESDELEIFLFDSGQSKMYKACLVDIHASPSGTKHQPAPDDGSCTPDYYNKDKLLGWLKIKGEIIEIENTSFFQKYSYLNLNDMYPNERADFDEQLFNKIVFSEKELQKQDRTIWKIRRRKAGDFEHESLASHYIPCNFSKKFSQKDSEQILWLSDIHFDNGDGMHNFPFNDVDQSKSLSSRICSLINNLSNENKCAGLAISGDLTWQSQIEGFEKASQFIADVGSSLNLTPDDIIICPGNHDVGLVSEDEYFEKKDVSLSQEPWSKLAVKYHDESKKNYINFYKQVFKRSPEESLAQGRKFLLGGHKVVEIAGLNSCYLQQVHGTFMGLGFIGEDQLKEVALKMGWIKSDSTKIPKKSNVTRIAMLHHHLTPVNEVEDAYLDFRYSVTLDAERLMRWIVENEIDYVLHGHMHRCFSIKITRRVRPLENISISNPEHTFQVIAMGSSGVNSNQIPKQDSKNYACLIDFSQQKPKFNFYSLYSQTEVDRIEDFSVDG